MTRLGMTGAETGALTADTGTTGTPIAQGTVTVVTTPARTGNGAYSITGGSPNYLRVTWTKTAGRWTYLRCWLRVNTLPTPTQIAMVYDTGTLAYSIYLRSDGTLSRNTSGPPASLPINTDEWHCLQIAVWGDGTTRRIILRLDGTQFDDTTTTLTFSGDDIRLGWPNGGAIGATIYLDDIAWNDDTGTDQNTWPDTNGAIVLLKPASDQAVGADWKLGTGTTPTANAYDAINNTPPQGVVSGTAGSDTKQIRDAVSNTAAPNANADIKLGAYNTVMPAGSSLRTAQAIAVLAHTSNSTPQDIEFGLLSSPSETRLTTNLAAGSAGIYPANWRNVRNPLIYNPAIAPTDQPVVRIGKRTASTVTHLCCLAALQLEYVPAPSTQRFLATA